MGPGRGRTPREPRRLDRFRSGRNRGGRGLAALRPRQRDEGRDEAARRRIGAGRDFSKGWTRDAAEPLTCVVCAGSPASRGPALSGPAHVSRHGVFSASRTSARGSPPPARGASGRLIRARTAPERLVVGERADGLRVPQVPGPAPARIPARDTLCPTRRPGRWRDRAIDAGTVSSPRSAPPGPSGRLTTGRRAGHSEHMIGILSRTKFERAGRERTSLLHGLAGGRAARRRGLDQSCSRSLARTLIPNPRDPFGVGDSSQPSISSHPRPHPDAAPQDEGESGATTRIPAGRSRRRRRAALTASISRNASHSSTASQAKGEGGALTPRQRA